MVPTLVMRFDEKSGEESDYDVCGDSGGDGSDECRDPGSDGGMRCCCGGFRWDEWSLIE